MKWIFALKYIGKTILIMFTVLSIGNQSNMGIYFNVIVLLASIAYCVGSIQYQFMRRTQKERDKILIKPLRKIENYN